MVLVMIINETTAQTNRLLGNIFKRMQHDMVDYEPLDALLVLNAWITDHAQLPDVIVLSSQLDGFDPTRCVEALRIRPLLTEKTGYSAGTQTG